MLNHISNRGGGGNGGGSGSQCIAGAAIGFGALTGPWDTRVPARLACPAALATLGLWAATFSRCWCRCWYNTRRLMICTRWCRVANIVSAAVISPARSFMAPVAPTLFTGFGAANATVADAGLTFQISSVLSRNSCCSGCGRGPSVAELATIISIAGVFLLPVPKQMTFGAISVEGIAVQLVASVLTRAKIVHVPFREFLGCAVAGVAAALCPLPIWNVANIFVLRFVLSLVLICGRMKRYGDVMNMPVRMATLCPWPARSPQT